LAVNNAALRTELAATKERLRQRSTEVTALRNENAALQAQVALLNKKLKSKKLRSKGCGG
jgi:predicted  nucleic acid-binding Zn-ribbon protein